MTIAFTRQYHLKYTFVHLAYPKKVKPNMP